MMSDQVNISAGRKISQKSSILRAAWLLLAVMVLSLLLLAIPHRYQMLLGDVYGYGVGLSELGLSLHFFASYFIFWELLVASASLLVAGLIVWRRSDDRFAMLVATVLTLLGIVPPLMDGLIASDPVLGWLIIILRLLAFICFMAVFCLFPNGKFQPKWMRSLLVSWIVFMASVLFLRPDFFTDTAIVPNTRTLSDALILLLHSTWFAAAVTGQYLRYKRISNAEEQQQSKWVLVGLALLILATLLSTVLLISVPFLRDNPQGRVIFTMIMGVLLLIAALSLPVTIALAILRYRLWDVDLLINRTLVYGTLTALVTVIYILLVGGLSSMALNQSGQIPILILATIIVLLGVRPLRSALQKATNQFVPIAQQDQAQAVPAKSWPSNEKKAGETPRLGSSLPRLLWVFNMGLGLLIFAAGLVLQIQQGFWQLPDPAGFDAVPILAQLPANNQPFNLYPLILTIAFVQAAAFVTVGIYIFWRKSQDLMGVVASWLLIGIGLGFTPTIVYLPLLSPAWHVPVTLFQVGLFGSAFLFLCLFPNGRFYPGWARTAFIIWVIYLLTWFMIPGFNLHRASTIWPAFIFAAVVGVGIIFQILRYRSVSKDDEKQQAKWVIGGIAIANLGLFGVALLLSLGLEDRPAILTAGMLSLGFLPIFIPISTGIAVLRYRLWEIDVILNRTLVYGGLTILITAIYIVFVGGLGSLVFLQSGLILGLLLATAFVLAGIRPFYSRWQAIVDQFVPMPEQKAPQIFAAAVPTNSLNKQSGRQWAVWASLGAAILLSVAIILLSAVNPNIELTEWLFYLQIPAFLIIGSLIINRHPENRIGRLCLMIGLLYFPVILGLSGGANLTYYIKSDALLPIILRFSLTLMQIIILLMFVYIPLLFPNGLYLNKKWGEFGKWFAILMAFPIIFTLIQPGPIFDWGQGITTTIDNPLGFNWPWLENIPQLTLIYLWGIPTLTAILASITSLVFRYRSSTTLIRQQIKLVVYFLSTFVAAFMAIELFFWLFNSSLTESAIYPTFEIFYSILGTIAWVGFPLIIGFAILKYHLFDIDIIINRTLVYGGLSLGIVLGYILVVGLLGYLFQSQSNFIIALLATGLIAVLFQPIRDRLQKGVNRLLYGERDDPYAALAKLAAQIQQTATPEETLQSVVQTIARTLKLPFVAIELVGENGRLGGAVTGKAVARVTELPLHYQNATVGYLVVTPRSPGESFTEREQRLLADMAAQMGAMAYSVRLTAALQQSREKLVLTREEERRRIRRDLHDELGPTLASQTFTMDAILDLMETDPQQAAHLLRRLKTQNQETVAEIRRLVYELRPPALDELGLLEAVRAHVGKLENGQTPKIKVNAQPEPLPILSAAVEVAAYRIALEAITNVMRHAQARHFELNFSIEGDGRPYLSIEVIDDGIGLPSDMQQGVGLISMRERAEELGGTFIIRNMVQGTRVLAQLPLTPTAKYHGQFADDGNHKA